MSKENNNRSAAGLRRSAIAERLRLREEWSALKGPSNETDKRTNTVLTKKHQNVIVHAPPKQQKSYLTNENVNISRVPVSQKVTCDALRGMVIFVDVGSEARALALRAALTAMGASVVPTWSPLVTHLVWTHGGCRNLRSKARALACRLVSPLWVEACAAAGRRLPEKVFPAPTRPSDLPSPTTLRRLLKKAEQENIPLHDFLSESQESSQEKQPRLRISSDTDRDTTNPTDTSHDTSHDKSHDKSHDTSHYKSREKCDKTARNNVEDSRESIDIETRVNTAPRRVMPISTTPQVPKKSKRKLFTNREPEIRTDEESDTEPSPPRPKKVQSIKLIQKEKRDLALAEKMARRLMKKTPLKSSQTKKPVLQNKQKLPRFVLTGMSRTERQETYEAIRSLKGKVQRRVNRKTTHIILGSCNSHKQNTQSPPKTNKTNAHSTPRTRNIKRNISMCNKCNSPGKILSEMFKNTVTVEDHSLRQEVNENIVCTCRNKNDLSGFGTLDSQLSVGILTDDIAHGNLDVSVNLGQDKEINRNISPRNLNNDQINDVLCSSIENITKNDKPRTVNALLGAVRGCRVLYGRWVLDSVKANRWLPHFGYEVPHLLKISQKARLERSAINKTHTEYAYNVFRDMAVKVSAEAEHRDAVEQLLTLCGAIVQDGGQKQNGRQNQDGRHHTADCDITIGVANGEVASKWVFDSIAAARMRTTRRYINKNIPVNAFSQRI